MNCDNINDVHYSVILSNTAGVIHGYCVHCKEEFYVREKDREKYLEYFKKDTLQPHENLYYKVYPKKMNVL